MRSTRRPARLAFVLCVAALFAPACHHAAPAAAAHSTPDFHRSDPVVIASTGRPQLLEFYGPT
jgi:hypothetical protein